MISRGRKWLIAGITIIAILVAIGIPMYQKMIRQSREATLTVNLGSMREVIKQYTQDKKRAPKSLQDLVDAGYFRELPIDPVTNSRSTWKPVIETVAISPGKTEQGITDVRSGSSSVSSKGTGYETW
jgi:general secretion pathway protein G